MSGWQFIIIIYIYIYIYIFIYVCVYVILQISSQKGGKFEGHIFAPVGI